MSTQSPEFTVQSQVVETAVTSTAEERIMLTGVTAYISAGGTGSRLNKLFYAHPERGISKALLLVGRPAITLIEHQVNKLQTSGVPTIVVGVGHHDNVAEHLAEVYPEDDSVHATYYDEQLGTGGDLVRAIRDQPDIFADDIFITNTDVLLDINEGTFLNFHREHAGELSIAVTLNRGVPNQDAYYVGQDGRVIYCAEAHQNPIPEVEASKLAAYRGSSTGALIANKEMLQSLDWQPQDGTLSLYGSIVASALEHGSMYAYNNGHRLFTDVGTVPSWNDMQTNSEILGHIYYGDES